MLAGLGAEAEKEMALATGRDGAAGVLFWESDMLRALHNPKIVYT